MLTCVPLPGEQGQPVRGALPVHHMRVRSACLAQPYCLIQELCSGGARGNAFAQEAAKGLRPRVGLQGVRTELKWAVCLHLYTSFWDI